MSIILKALKRVQNRDAEEAPGSRVENPEAEAWPAPARAVSSPPADAEAFGEKPPAGEDARWPVNRPPLPATRARFSGAPKALIGLLIALGIFTTGWFVNKIYSSARPSVKSEAPAPTRPLPLAAQKMRAPQKQAAAPAGPSPTTASHKIPAGDTLVAAGVPIVFPPVEPLPAAVTPTDEAQPPVEKAQPPAKNAAEKPPSKNVAAVRPAPAPAAAVSESKPKKKEKPKLKINAIAWRGEEPKAIVNMQRVYVGDVVDGATVVEIGPKSIIFEYEGENFKVRF